jgi:outer membrane protein TolC
MHRILLLLFFLPLLAGAQQPELLTLEEAIRVGLENNFQIRIARRELEVTRNNNTIANAGFLPAVDATAAKGYSIEDTRNEFIENRIQEVNAARSQRFNADLLLNWTIFDGMGMFITRERLAELQKAGEQNLKLVVENAIADISVAYYQVLLEQSRVQLIGNTLDLSEERRRISNAKYQIGKASKLEYLAAQVDYNADTSNLLNQYELLQASKIQLNTLMGRDPGTDFNVTDNIPVNRNLELDQIMEQAENWNQAYRLLQTQKNVSMLEMKEIRAERYPEINLNAGYLLATSSAEAGFIVSRRSNGPTYGVSARLNIFDGFNINRRQQNAKIDLEIAELQIEQFQIQLDGDINRTYLRYRSNLALYELEQLNLDVARENADIALERYRLGNSDALELREAQINAANAENRLFNAAYNAKVSEIELQRLAGQLSAADQQ